MNTRFPAIERIYDLAKSGRFTSLAEIRRQRQKEGYSRTEIGRHLEGMGIRRQLLQLCGTAKAKRS